MGMQPTWIYNMHDAKFISDDDVYRITTSKFKAEWNWFKGRKPRNQNSKWILAYGPFTAEYRKFKTLIKTTQQEMEPKQS